MKNLKSFKLFESNTESERTIALKQYFMNIEDAYDVEMYYNETSKDYFNILIKFSDIENTLSELNDRYKKISEILSLVQRNIKKIEEDFIIDEVEVLKNTISFNLYYNVGDTNDLSIEQLFILDENDFVVRVNRYKIKKVFNEKYNLTVDTIHASGEYDDEKDEPYSKISVKVTNISLGKATWLKKRVGGSWEKGSNQTNVERRNEMIEEWQNIYGLNRIEFIPFGGGCLINFILEVPVDE